MNGKDKEELLISDVHSNLVGSHDHENHKGSDVASSDKNGHKIENPVKVSFRDKVVGAASSSALNNVDCIDVDKMIIVNEGSTDTDIPSIEFSSDVREVFSEPYRDVIIIKVLGKTFSYTAITHKLRGVWRTKGGYEVLDVGFGYFLIKFDLLKDKERVLLGGPWMIGGNYVAVKPWCPSFRPCEKTFGSTLVWIRITGLNIWYYHEKLMMRIAALIGKPIRVDLATQSALRGKYARACVQINLGCPVIQKVKVDGFEYDVEYENLHLICNRCKCFGHVTRDCDKTEKTPTMECHGYDGPTPTIIIPESIPVPSRNTADDRSKGVFEFGINSNNDGNGNCDDIVNAGEKSSATELHGNSESAHVKEDGWTKVQTKGKGKLGSQTKPNDMKNSHKAANKEASIRILKPKPKMNIATSSRSGSTKVTILVGSGSTEDLNHSHATTPPLPPPHKRRRPPSLQSSPIETNNVVSEVVLNKVSSSTVANEHGASVNKMSSESAMASTTAMAAT